MPDRIRLELSCPDCGQSLMDPDHLLEGAPSVLCDIQVPGPNPRLPRKTPIRFSSFYGSSVFECAVRLEDNTRMILSCPHCQTTLHGDFSCPNCGEPMVSLDIQGGGKMVACTKRGCKHHFIQLDENVPGLERLFHMPRRPTDGSVPSPLHARQIQARYHPEDYQEIITQGTFLAAYCPHCQESIIEGENMVFEVETQDGQTGLFSLSAYLNVFTNQSTVAIPHAEQVRDLRCVHCAHSLMSPEMECGECGGPTAMVTVSAMRKLISFYICMKMGCHWHGMSAKDNQMIKLEDSLEW